DLVEGGKETSVILRRAPGGTRVSDTAVGLETEAALIQAAERRGVPVPQVRYVLAPEDGLGHGFIMSFVEGETLGGRIVRDDKLEGARQTLARQCGEILARIHAIPADRVPQLKVST